MFQGCLSASCAVRERDGIVNLLASSQPAPGTPASKNKASEMEQMVRMSQRRMGNLVQVWSRMDLENWENSPVN